MEGLVLIGVGLLVSLLVTYIAGVILKGDWDV